MSHPLFDFEISGSELRRAAQWLDRLAQGRVQTGAEYLSGVLIRADSASLQVSFSATNVETYGVSIADAKVRYSGQCVVSARLLAAIAKGCKGNETAAFLQSAGSVGVTAGATYWELPLIDAEYWPRFDMRGQHAADVDADAFTTAINRVLPAVDKQKIYPMWGGLSVDITAERIAVATTDKNVIAVAHVPVTSYTRDAYAIVSADSLGKALGGLSGSSSLALSPSDRGFVMGGKRFRAMARLVTEFPNCAVAWNFVDQATHSSVIVDVGEVAEALSRISFLSDETAPIRLQASEGELRLAVEGRDVAGKGSAYAVCGAEVIGEPHDEVVLQQKYLDGCLTGAASKAVELRFGSTRKSPVVVFAQDGNGVTMDDYLCVVRPIDLTRRR